MKRILFFLTLLPTLCFTQRLQYPGKTPMRTPIVTNAFDSTTGDVHSIEQFIRGDSVKIWLGRIIDADNRNYRTLLNVVAQKDYASASTYAGLRALSAGRDSAITLLAASTNGEMFGSGRRVNATGYPTGALNRIFSHMNDSTVFYINAVRKYKMDASGNNQFWGDMTLGWDAGGNRTLRLHSAGFGYFDIVSQTAIAPMVLTLPTVSGTIATVDGAQNFTNVGTITSGSISASGNLVITKSDPLWELNRTNATTVRWQGEVLSDGRFSLSEATVGSWLTIAKTTGAVTIPGTLGVTGAITASTTIKSNDNSLKIVTDVNSSYITNNISGVGITGNYVDSKYAEQITLDAATGFIKFRVAPSGTAGNPITFTDALTLSSTGAGQFASTLGVTGVLTASSNGTFGTTSSNAVITENYGGLTAPAPANVAVVTPGLILLNDDSASTTTYNAPDFQLKHYSWNATKGAHEENSWYLQNWGFSTPGAAGGVLVAIMKQGAPTSTVKTYASFAVDEVGRTLIGYTKNNAANYFGFWGEDFGQWGIILSGNGKVVVGWPENSQTSDLYNTGHVLSYTDNTKDIGQSGANRFRHMYLSGNATVAGNVIAGAPMRLKSYTVATLPAGTQGDIAYVTDAVAPTFLTALTGGGTVVTPAFYNGTSWVSF